MVRPGVHRLTASPRTAFTISSPSTTAHTPMTASLNRSAVTIEISRPVARARYPATHIGHFGTSASAHAGVPHPAALFVRRHGAPEVKLPCPASARQHCARPRQHCAHRVSPYELILRIALAGRVVPVMMPDPRHWTRQPFLIPSFRSHIEQRVDPQQALDSSRVARRGVEDLASFVAVKSAYAGSFLARMLTGSKVVVPPCPRATAAETTRRSRG
jgi:hypothetical protein